MFAVAGSPRRIRQVWQLSGVGDENEISRSHLLNTDWTCDSTFADRCGAKDHQGLPGGVASQQSCQSSERHHGKVLRGSMSRRWCSHSPNRRSGTINCSSSKHWSNRSSFYADPNRCGAKDHQGLPGGVAIQQSCQSSERHHGKVLRGSMSRRWCSHSPNRRSGCIFSGPYSGSHTDRANTPCA
jgi:hypothetical protein